MAMYPRLLAPLALCLLLWTPLPAQQPANIPVPDSLSLEDQNAGLKLQNQLLERQRILDRFQQRLEQLIRDSPIGKQRQAAVDEMTKVSAELATFREDIDSRYQAQGWEWNLTSSKWVKQMAQASPLPAQPEGSKEK